MNFSDAIKLPFKQPIQTLLLSLIFFGGYILTFILIIPSLFIPFLYVLGYIPFIFAQGYLLEVARSVWKKSPTLPEFKNPKGLFIHGILTWVILLVYQLPLLFIIFVFMAIGVATFSASNTAGILIGAILFILGLVIGAIFYLLSYGATMAYAQRFEFSDAFQLKAIWRRAVTGDFFIALILAMIWGFILMLGSLIIIIVGWIFFAIFGIGALGITTFALLAGGFGPEPLNGSVKKDKKAMKSTYEPPRPVTRARKSTAKKKTTRKKRQTK